MIYKKLGVFSFASNMSRDQFDIIRANRLKVDNISNVPGSAIITRTSNNILGEISGISGKKGFSTFS